MGSRLRLRVTDGLARDRSRNGEIIKSPAGCGSPWPRAERQRIQLRKDIIDAAMAEFAARGYHQTSIALILTGAVNVLRNPEDKALQKRMADAVLKLLVGGIARHQPAVLIVLELPGMPHHTVRLAQRLQQDGFCVYIPLLFGKAMNAYEPVKNLIRCCIQRKFHILATHKPSPVSEWLRALCWKTPRHMRLMISCTRGVIPADASLIRPASM